MTFNTALTGLRSANTELEVTGNNIANASTVGFKQSRAEFADVYASTVIGGGSDAVGSGVRVANIAQQFSQGNIGFTENALDLAINGGGFFVLNDQGTQVFSRAGQFGVDDLGFITAATGARLQGFSSDAAGNLSGVLSDLQLDVVSIDPRQTSEVNIAFNLDADSLVLAQRGNDLVSDGTDVATLQLGSTVNGYLADTVEIDGTTYNIPSAANQPANVIAAALSNVNGVVSASAVTTLDFTYTVGGGGTTINSGDLLINGQNISGTTPAEVAASISALPNLQATESGGTITIVSTIGEDVRLNIPGASPVSIVADGTAMTAGDFATKGGEVSVRLDEGVTFTNTAGNGSIFSAAPALTPYAENTFNPGDQATYNDATSFAVYDSLGSSHTVQMFFVKESVTAVGQNTWSVYVQIDGQDVGDPTPTQAQYTVRFNNDGTLNTASSDEILISNWEPLDAEGNPNGALGPSNVPTAVPIPVPAESSNFVIDITGATQFSGTFGVNSLDQTGFATGQLSSIDIDETGIIFARYSNGEALVLGQVALADFNNQQGLSPIGDTSWAESFQSGPPVIGAPRSAALGAIQSGALEDSNVDLAEELVALIIAQRNFQANARTIETANEVTQTVINLR